jgi:hypothetical protein
MKRLHFYPNTKDRTHCFQASIRMVLKYWFPKKEFSYKTLDILTKKVKGMWTWPMEGVLALQNMGLTILDIGIFDYVAFSKNPVSYLKDYFKNPQVVQEQLQHCDIEQERKSAERYAQHIRHEKRVAIYDDILSALQQKYLLIINVNSRLLNRKKGYSGHFVVVYRATSHTIWMYDPGFPPKKKRRVTRRVFEEAWEYPNKETKTLREFRL